MNDFDIRTPEEIVMDIKELSQGEIKNEKLKIIKWALQNDYKYDDGGSYINITIPQYKLKS